MFEILDRRTDSKRIALATLIATSADDPDGVGVELNFPKS
jgi:hypothetical protein